MSNPPFTIARVVRRFIALGNELNILLQTPKTYENGRQALADEANALLNEIGDAPDSFVDEFNSYHCMMAYLLEYLGDPDTSYLYMCNSRDLWVENHKAKHLEKVATLPSPIGFVPAFRSSARAPPAVPPSGPSVPAPPYTPDPIVEVQAQSSASGMERKVGDEDGDIPMAGPLDDDPSTGPASRLSPAELSADEDPNSDADSTQARIPAGPMPAGPCENCYIGKTHCVGYYIRNPVRPGVPPKRNTWALSCICCAKNKKGCAKFVMDDIPLARAQRPEFEVPTADEDTRFVSRTAARAKMLARFADAEAKLRARTEAANPASGSRPRASGSDASHNPDSHNPRYPDLLQLLSNLNATLEMPNSEGQSPPIKSFAATKILFSMSRHLLDTDTADRFESFASDTLEADFPDYFADAPPIQYSDSEDEEEDPENEDVGDGASLSKQRVGGNGV